MTDAPEKIWAMAGIKGSWVNAHCTSHEPRYPCTFIYEYTRSDIAQARIDKLEAELNEAETLLSELRAIVRAALKEQAND